MGENEVAAGIISKVNCYLQFLHHEIEWLSKKAYCTSHEEMSHNEARLTIAKEIVKQLSGEIKALVNVEIPYLNNFISDLKDDLNAH